MNAKAGDGTRGVPPGAPAVVLHGEGEPSGLADMLCQFFEQTLAGDPGKAEAARRLRGEVAFRAAEDTSVCVCIRFTGEAVELRDGAPASGVASMTGDLLSVAHLTTGQESPMALVARRRLGVRFRMRDVPFLLRLLRLMRIEAVGERVGAEPAAPERGVRLARTWGWAAVAAAAAAAGAATGLAWCAGAG